MFEKSSYISPEILQIENNQDSEEKELQDFYATKSNDIFSMGLVFLEISNLESSK